MNYRQYKKNEIAAKMLDTALDLYFSAGDGFSIIHLAAAAEEIYDGLLRSEQNKNRTDQITTARGKSIAALKEIHNLRGSTRTEKEIGTSLNLVRNKTKHHNPEKDSDLISACLELEVDSALSRTIENYILYHGYPTDKISQYTNHVAQRSLQTPHRLKRLFDGQ